MGQPFYFGEEKDAAQAPQLGGNLTTQLENAENANCSNIRTGLGLVMAARTNGSGIASQRVTEIEELQESSTATNNTQVLRENALLPSVDSHISDNGIDIIQLTPAFIRSFEIGESRRQTRLQSLGMQSNLPREAGQERIRRERFGTLARIPRYPPQNQARIIRGTERSPFIVGGR